MVIRRRKLDDIDIIEETNEDNKNKLIARKYPNKKKWVENQLGFPLSSLTSLERFTYLLYNECDSESLAAIRIMFGILMLIDTVEERGFSNAEALWGDPNECRFPLIYFLQPLPLQLMCLLYFIMCIGAIGITLGLYFRQSCLAILIPYWYILLLNKSAWNNHSYLFGLLLLLMTFSSSNNCWSLDKYLRRTKTSTIPMWNYTIIRFQVFALYFFAGLKKINSDWLNGYSMTTLSKHWVFNPFKILLSADQVDLWVVHIIGFLLDFTAGFLIFFDKTRYIAFFFLTIFHLMNSRLFHIGMFPYMCLVTMPIFCSMDWPTQLCIQIRRFISKILSILQCKKIHQSNIKVDETSACILEKQKMPPLNLRKKLTSICVLMYILLQLFLPYSHFITKGYNNWTNGLYGYSWDMMVHTWDRNRIIVKVVDKLTEKEYFLNHEAYVPSDKWATHADMVLQFAHCVDRKLKNQFPLMTDISIHVDVWCSLNDRFQQRMFNPNVDLLQANWSPFSDTNWLMPLMDDLSQWREKISNLQNEVWLWSNYSDAVFYADFPGLTLENFISDDFSNVSLTVLEGKVVIKSGEKDYKTLVSGQSQLIPKNSYHWVQTISPSPSCYMYSFTNQTRMLNLEPVNIKVEKPITELIYKDVENRLKKFRNAARLLTNILN